VLILGALIRVVGPLAFATWTTHWVLLSGVLWVLAFVLFLATYAPMLVRPRADGRPG